MFFSELHPFSLSQRHVLQEMGAPIEHVYFIEEGVSSVLTSMANGSTIEVGMIGIEGMVGIAALLGGKISSQLVVMQIPGSALRMSAALSRLPLIRARRFAGLRCASPKPCLTSA